MSEQGRDTDYEDELTSDIVNVSWVTEFDRLSEWECADDWVIHKMSEFATVKIKQFRSLLPNAQSDQWCIQTSDYQVANCITTPCINNIYGYLAFEFMTVFTLYFICYLILLVTFT